MNFYEAINSKLFHLYHATYTIKYEQTVLDGRTINKYFIYGPIQSYWVFLCLLIRAPPFL